MGDLLTLCYHGVSASWPEHTAVAPGDLERHVRWLLRRGYRPATFAAAVAARGGQTSRSRTLVVTFDDGYRSVHARALPVLRRLGVPGTAFVVSGLVGGGPLELAGARWLGGPHASELDPTSWDELAELAAAGWEIGSHTRTHPMLTQVGDAELAAELRDSRAEIEDRLGQPCRTLAYPYGDVDVRVAAAARDAGYAAAATLYPGLVAQPSPWQEPRVGVSRHHRGGWRFRAKAAKATRRVRASSLGRRASAPLYRLKHGMTPPRAPEQLP